MTEGGNRKGARIFRWIACGMATLAALLHIAHLGGDILLGGSNLENVTPLQILLASLMALYCASLLLCWKWLRASGWLSLAAIGSFIGILLPQGFVGAWSIWWVFLLTVTMLALPSLLLLAAAWILLTQRQEG